MKLTNSLIARTTVAFFKLIRWPIFLTCTIIVVLGAAVGGAFSLQIFLAILLIALLIVVGNGINDISDYDIDRLNLKNAKDRPLVSGDVSSEELFRLVRLAGFASVVLSISFGIWMVVLSAAFVLYSYLYSLRPVRLTDRPILSPVTLALTYSVYPFLVGFASAKLETVVPWLLIFGIYLGFLSRLLLKDFRDVKGDKRYGKQTFVLQYGAKKTAIASYIVSLGSLVAIVFATNYATGILIPLVLGNLLALWSFYILSRVKDTESQLREVKFLAKIGNISVLVIVLYYTISISVIYGVSITLIPLVVGLLLITAAWRQYRY